MAADLDSAVDAVLPEPVGSPNPQVSDQQASGRRTLALVGRVYLPTFVVAGCAAWLAWFGWTILSGYGPARSIRAGQFELAGPAVLGFVLVVFLIEQISPAERRAVWARGHLLDLVYLLAYATLVVPLIVLTGAGFSAALARVAPWLVMPHFSAVPGGASPPWACSRSTPWTGSRTSAITGSTPCGGCTRCTTPRRS